MDTLLDAHLIKRREILKDQYQQPHIVVSAVVSLKKLQGILSFHIPVN